MLLRFDPFRDPDRLAHHVWQQPQARTPIMPMDAYRERERFVVLFDLPGVRPDSLDVTVEGNMLTVSAQRNWQPAQTQQVIAAERPTGSFQRQVYLGDGLDTDRVEARYDNGVLTVSIPIADSAKPRKIEISAGGHPKAIEAPAA